MPRIVALQLWRATVPFGSMSPGPGAAIAAAAHPAWRACWPPRTHDHDDAACWTSGARATQPYKWPHRRPATAAAFATRPDGQVHQGFAVGIGLLGRAAGGVGWTRTRGLRSAAPKLADDHCHYKVLGVPNNANAKDIKIAFYDLCKKHHPDVAGPDSDAVFSRVQKAYEVLADRADRAQYDRSRLGNGNAGGGQRVHPSQQPQQQARDPGFYPGDVPRARSRTDTKFRKAMTVVMLICLCIPVFLVSNSVKTRMRSQQHGANYRRPSLHEIQGEDAARRDRGATAEPPTHA